MDDQARLSPSRTNKSISVDDAPPPAEEPERLRQLLDMAFWHNEVGNIPGAILASEAALKLDPNSTSALSLLGCLYEKQGNDEKAIEAFQKVVELNPDSIADYEKLEHLLRGVRVKAVTPSIGLLLTPPVVLHAVRRYPKLPVIVSACVVFLLAAIGVGALWNHYVNGAAKDEPVSSVASINPSFRADEGMLTTPQAPSATPPQATPQTYQQPVQTASSAAPQQADPFGLQGNSYQQQYNGRQSYSSAPQDYSQQMPSEQNIKPLAVAPPDVSDHVIDVAPQQPDDQHVVMVNPPGTDSSGSSDSSDSGSRSDPNTDDISTAPASHIYITVHNNGDGADSSDGVTPLPGGGGRSISLRENAGASLQQKGLNLQDSENYKAAIAAYESAIAAYQDDENAGRDVDAAKRGIDACQVAVEICKQSQ